MAEYTRSPEFITHGSISFSTRPRRASACRNERRGMVYSGRVAVSLRDNAIVAYAETKVMEKSDRDVFRAGRRDS